MLEKRESVKRDAREGGKEAIGCYYLQDKWWWIMIEKNDKNVT